MARKSKKSVANEAMKDPDIKKYIVKLVGKEVSKEVRCMASDSADSILKSMDADQLKCFTWDTLLNEIGRFAPVLQTILESSTRTRVPRSNTKGVIGMCLAVILKHRNPKMNLVQKINSLILYTM